MPSVFTRIAAGEIPGRVVYADDDCFALLTIAPLRPGHTLVVPRLEVEEWTDLPAEVRDRLFAVAQLVGRAVRTAFPCRRVALLVLGLEVPHVHLHLVPIDDEAQVDFTAVDHDPAPAALDDAAARITAALAAG